MSDCSVILKSQPTITVLRNVPDDYRIGSSQETTTILQSLPQSCRITTIGIQGLTGPTGPIGPSGASALFEGTAGASILAFTAVVMVAGLLYPADPTDISHAGLVVGLAISSASVSDPVTVQVVGEVISGVFPSNSRMYIGLAGVLSTSPSAIGAVWKKSIGLTKNVTTLVLSIQPTIII